MTLIAHFAEAMAGPNGAIESYRVRIGDVINSFGKQSRASGCCIFLD